MKLLRYILFYLFFTLAFYLGNIDENYVHPVTLIETYSFKGYYLYISVERIAKCKYKLYFHRNPIKIGDDYIVIKYCGPKLSPGFTIYYDSENPDTILIPQNQSPDVKAKSSSLFTIIDTVFPSSIQKQNPKVFSQTLYRDWVDRLRKEYRENGILIQGNESFDGLNYRNLKTNETKKATRIY